MQTLLKVNNAYDAGLVEEMIYNASLPLAIVYTNWAEASIFASTDRTLLFYYYEPDTLINGTQRHDSGSATRHSLTTHSYSHPPLIPSGDMMRVDFEDPAACNMNETFTAFSNVTACDFHSGGVH